MEYLLFWQSQLHQPIFDLAAKRKMQKDMNFTTMKPCNGILVWLLCNQKLSKKMRGRQSYMGSVLFGYTGFSAVDQTVFLSNVLLDKKEKSYCVSVWIRHSSLCVSCVSVYKYLLKKKKKTLLGAALIQLRDLILCLCTSVLYNSELRSGWQRQIFSGE